MDESKGTTLLVVEDDRTAARQLKWSFDAFDVELAGDREEALAAMARSRMRNASKRIFPSRRMRA